MDDPAVTSRLYGEVILGPGTVVEDFCVLGHPATGGRGQGPTRIGAGGLIRSQSVVYAGVEIGDRFQGGHGILVREDCRLGDDCSVGTGSVLEFAVTVGHGVRLHSRCFVPEYSVLEDGCWLGPGVILTNSRYPAGPRSKETLEGVRIGARARVGAGAVLLPGVTLGRGSMVGAGALVSRDVPEGMLALGTPARVVGAVSDLTDSGGQVYPAG